MPTVAVFDMTGKKTGEMELNAAVFGIEPNMTVVHAAVKNYLANQRQGTQSTLTRAEVRGGGIKPWRQKGTGRARQGTTRAAQFRHGGVVFGPHPRSYAFRVNNKVVKLAMASVLSGKLAADELFVVDGFNFEKPSTKAAAKALEALGCKGRVTVVVNDEDVNSFLSFRNLEKVRVIGASESNTYDLLDNGSLVMTKDAVEYVQEVLS